MRGMITLMVGMGVVWRVQCKGPRWIGTWQGGLDHGLVSIACGHSRSRCEAGLCQRCVMELGPYLCRSMP